MAELAYILTIILIKTIIVLFSLVVSAGALILALPYALFWPTPPGMTWGHAVRTRMRRVTAFVWRAVERAYFAIDTPA